MRKAFQLLLCCALAAVAGEFPIGAKLETITVTGQEGNAVSWPVAGRTTVLVFTSARCPISHDYADRMIGLFRQFEPRGVAFVFVNANANESREEIEAYGKKAGFPFPVYKDEANVLADRVGATVTPETYLFDSSGTLRYHGQIDDARNPARVQVNALANAITAVLAGKEVERTETKAFGCTIKRVGSSS